MASLRQEVTDPMRKQCLITLEEWPLPYIANKHSKLKLGSACPALVIFDHVRGQCRVQEAVLFMLKNSIFIILYHYHSSQLHWQALDVSINKAAKEYVCALVIPNMALWQSLHSQLPGDPNAEVNPSDHKMSVAKPPNLMWMTGLQPPNVNARSYQRIQGGWDR